MDSYHSQLLTTAAYPDATKSVAFRETHISRLYLTDTHVYKLKKPIDLGFLDFTTLERRRYFCHEELRLNRRFAPETYLGIVELREQDGIFRFDGPGKLVEYAVCMKRLPETEMLDSKIDCNDPALPQLIDRLAAHLNQLWQHAEICCEPAAGANARIVADNCRENLEQTEPAVGRTLSSEAHRLATVYTENSLQNLEKLFAEREKQGYVRDGHGDLHTGNICLTDPIQVYDCIEFNRRFRVGDIAADLAFLLMDLDFRQRRDLSAQLLSSYQSHAKDPDLPRLLPFYKFYRAWVRGKVDSILALEDDAESVAREQGALLAWRYFNLALGYLLRPALLLTTGLMGVGKSTLGRAFAAATGATLLHSDALRKRLAGQSPESAAHDEFGRGLYSGASTRKTYDTLLELGGQALERGQSVIVDASFASAEERCRFLDMARQKDLAGYLLHVHCPEEVALQRLDARQSRGGDISDGRREIYHDQARAFTPVNTDPAILDIDSRLPVDYNVQSVLCQILIDQGAAS